MKFRPLLAALTLGFCLITPTFAQDAAASAEPAASPESAALAADVKVIVSRISQTLKASPTPVTAEMLAPDFAALDALLVKYPEKNDDTAQVVILKAMIHTQLLHDDAKAREIYASVQKNFPDTESARTVEKIIAQMDQVAKAKAVAAALTGQAAPELHFKWSSKGDLTTLSALKGKVVVLDFWATWCGPCIASFPQLREHVEQFKDTPVAFVGVTSIQGFVAGLPAGKINTKNDPAKELALLPDFIKAKAMTWEVAVSDEPVFNPDYGITGIPYLAIVAPDGTVRHAGLHPGDASADIAGKIAAILKEFHLPLPAKS